MIGYECSMYKAKSDFIEVQLKEELPEPSSDWWLIPLIIFGLLGLIGLIHLIKKKFYQGAKKD